MTSAGKLLAIKLPDNKITKLSVSANTTVGEACDILLRNLTVNAGEEYGITMDSIVFDRSSKIAKIPAAELMFRKILFTVNIKIEETNEVVAFGLDPLLTIRETILFIEHSNFKSNIYNIQTRPPSTSQTPNHELTLITNNNINNSSSTNLSNGIKMEYDRTLQSYRMKGEDLLVLSSVQSKGGAWKVQGQNNTEFCLIITATDHNLQKAMKFDGSTKYATVIEQFLKKANVKESKYFFGLYLKVAGENVQLLPSWDIATGFPLPSPARLDCKYITREPRSLFGVDPLTLPFVYDNGFQIPEILAILKDMLILSDGIDCEGVFRKSGLESEMTAMKESFHAGKPFVCDNTHSIATMMKRWFKELPKRLFSHVDPDFVDNDRCLQIEQNLTPLEQSLFYWLLDLLLIVAEKSDKNFMTASNLGIVWGPGMTGSSQDLVLNELSLGIMDSFNETRLGISIIEKNVTYYREKRLVVPRVDIRSIVPTPINDDYAPIKKDNLVVEKEKKIGIVLYENVAENEGEVSVKKGAKVTILDDSNDDWILVSVDGKSGYLPKSYLEIQIIPQTPPPSPLPLPPSPVKSPLGNSNNNNANNNANNNNNNNSSNNSGGGLQSFKSSLGNSLGRQMMISASDLKTPLRSTSTAAMITPPKRPISTRAITTSEIDTFNSSFSSPSSPNSENVNENVKQEKSVDVVAVRPVIKMRAKSVQSMIVGKLPPEIPPKPEVFSAKPAPYIPPKPAAFAKPAEKAAPVIPPKPPVIPPKPAAFSKN